MAGVNEVGCVRHCGENSAGKGAGLRLEHCLACGGRGWLNLIRKRRLAWEGFREGPESGVQLLPFPHPPTLQRIPLKNDWTREEKSGMASLVEVLLRPQNDALGGKKPLHRPLPEPPDGFFHSCENATQKCFEQEESDNKCPLSLLCSQWVLLSLVQILNVAFEASESPTNKKVV